MELTHIESQSPLASSRAHAVLGPILFLAELDFLQTALHCTSQSAQL